MCVCVYVCMYVLKLIVSFHIVSVRRYVLYIFLPWSLFVCMYGGELIEYVCMYVLTSEVGIYFFS